MSENNNSQLLVAETQSTAQVDDKAPQLEPTVIDNTKHFQNLKLVEEFQYLLEKSQQLFAGLRDLPPTGRNWQPYFQRTFEVYTKLWKFQQQHRAILENKDYYGLKRSEIGEAASKIGQLYYHYYLRTSETNYLFESYIFYDAIRKRQYFKEAVEAKTLPLTIKKLRYYARFIVVCLLLNRFDVIKKLMEELTALVDEYSKEFKPSDAAEWNVVLSEISTFLEAEKKLTPVDGNGNVLPLPSRVQIDRAAKFDKDGIPKMKLQETILVGHFQNQIKFSELTLDMYRILQSLEREPASQLNVGSMSNVSKESSENKEGKKDGEEQSVTTDKSATRRNNPHKYLLYRPTFAQLMLYIATAFKDIGENSALLIYLSADGAKRAIKSDESDKSYSGGIATAVSLVRKPVTTEAAATSTTNLSSTSNLNAYSSDLSSLIHCLHPNDLIPFTRKPLFLIVDSTNSTAFKTIPKIFPAPLVCLMGPTEYPSSIKDTTQLGSLFTLFLHAPLKAFAFISDTLQMSIEIWSQCVVLIGRAEKCIIDSLDVNLNGLDKSFKRFLQDDFLRQFICRFVLCNALLNSHNSFKDPKHFPTSLPALPPILSSNPELLEILNDLASTCDASSLYDFTPKFINSAAGSVTSVVGSKTALAEAGSGSVRGSVAVVAEEKTEEEKKEDPVAMDVGETEKADPTTLE